MVPQVLIHPESVVHSMVELLDGTVIAQLGVPDMGLPIQYALTYPERKPSRSDRLDLTAYPNGLHFYEPDLEALPCLAWHGSAEDCPAPVHRRHYTLAISSNYTSPKSTEAPNTRGGALRAWCLVGELGLRL